VPDDRSKWLPKYPEPKDGEWISYDYGMNSRGWYLDCGPMFHADVRAMGGEYALSLNMHPIARNGDLEAIKRTAERHIIARVRKMLPAYRVIFVRARAAAAAGDRQEG